MKYLLEMDNETINAEMIVNCVNHLIFSNQAEKNKCKIYNHNTIDCYAEVETQKEISAYDKQYFKEENGVILTAIN